MTKPSFAKLTDADSIEECCARAVRKAMMMHKALGVPIVVQRDGKMVTIPPEEIEIESGMDKPVRLRVEPWMY